MTRVVAAVGPLSLAACLFVLGGCGATPKRDPAFASTPPAVAEPSPKNGAIYHPGYEMALFRDLKAHRVGDILTVRLMEKTDASKEAETTIDKDTEFNIDSPTLFGKSVGINGYTLESSMDAQRNFEGAADSNQSNSLTGNITVTVAAVLPNGNLVIRGERVYTLNRGHEQIRISGIVRPEDITTENTVLSTQVADATISYTGQGELADSNAAGWLARFFLSPFFPF